MASRLQAADELTLLFLPLGALDPLPAGLCSSTARNFGSSLGMSSWCMRTCLSSSSAHLPGNVPVVFELTFVNYRVEDIGALYPGNMGIHSPGSCAQGRVVSFRSCA